LIRTQTIIRIFSRKKKFKHEYVAVVNSTERNQQCYKKTPINSRMFEYIALRFESTLLDFELMEKVKSSLLSHCWFSLFWLCWAMYLMYVSIVFIYHLWSVDTYPGISYGICLLSSFLEQPDIFRAGSLMIATSMLSTLCIHGCVYTGLMLLCAYMRYRL
jgi:hypothetical protein